MKTKIKKGDIVSFYDSLNSWVVTGFTNTVDHKHVVIIRRIIPKPEVIGYANKEDLIIR